MLRGASVECVAALHVESAGYAIRRKPFDRDATQATTSATVSMDFEFKPFTEGVSPAWAMTASVNPSFVDPHLRDAVREAIRKVEER